MLLTWVHFYYRHFLDQGLVHMESQILSPTHVSKSQHGGKVPTCEPQVIINIWLNVIRVGSWLFYAKIFSGLGFRVGSSLLLNPTCNTSPKPCLQKMLPCRHPCHSWDLGLGTPCEVISLTSHALNDWDCVEWDHVTWDPMWTRPNGKCRGF